MYVCVTTLRERYAVATEQEVSLWWIRHEQEYTKLRGGHTRAVVALHACCGGTVRARSQAGKLVIIPHC